MLIGKLRHRLTLQEATTTANSYGERVKSWGDVDTIWARVEPLSGRELDFARGFGAKVSHRVVIRYRAGTIPTMRLEFGSNRYLYINSVLDVEERHEEMHLFCSEEIA